MGFDIYASQVALVVKRPPTKAGGSKRCGLNPGLGRSPGGRHGNPPFSLSILGSWLLDTNYIIKLGILLAIGHVYLKPKVFSKV